MVQHPPLDYYGFRHPSSKNGVPDMHKTCPFQPSNPRVASFGRRIRNAASSTHCSVPGVVSDVGLGIFDAKFLKSMRSRKIAFAQFCSLKKVDSNDVQKKVDSNDVQPTMVPFVSYVFSSCIFVKSTTSVSLVWMASETDKLP